MARKSGLHRRRDSRFWWINVALPNGQRLRASTGTENREEAEAYLAKLQHEAYQAGYLGIKPRRSWQEAVVRYLSLKAHLRDVEKQRRLCRKLDGYLGHLKLNDITGDVIWSIVEGETKKGNKPATINRCLALVRSILRMAHFDWQWIDCIPKVRLLSGEVERDRWLTKEEAARLLSFCPPHLAALVRFALATGCRAREIAGLEWVRVDLERRTAWLDQTKNGTPRGVPLNRDAVAVLEGERGKHPEFCFTFRGKPIRYELTNTAWQRAVRLAQLGDLRFHDLRHTWASWHRQAGTSTDELKELGGWKSRCMVDRYAKFATDHLAAAATRIESECAVNVPQITRFRHVGRKPELRLVAKSLIG
ncbi:MAG: site-specific integrase [Betaproteobacteria bacterium]|nr:MAG: site-specific integrase [Betaproteobacteria bacterium]